MEPVLSDMFFFSVLSSDRHFSVTYTHMGRFCVCISVKGFLYNGLLVVHYWAFS